MLRRLANAALKFANVLATVVIAVALVVLLRAVFTGAGDVPSVDGYSVLRTLTGSMEPAIPVHSLVVVQEVDPSTLEVGDIITFRSTDAGLEGALNTHRIADIEQDSAGSELFRTKGDANAVEDASLVAPENVVGKVVYVSAALGVVVSLLSNPLVFFPVIVVPLAILLVFEILKMVRAVRETSRAQEEEALRAAVEALRAKRQREIETSGAPSDACDSSERPTEDAPSAANGQQGTIEHAGEPFFEGAACESRDAKPAAEDGAENSGASRSYNDRS